MKSSKRPKQTPAAVAPEPANKAAAAKLAPEPADVLKLYAQSLDEIRRWFRNSSTPGIERGHIVLGEMFFTYSVEALSLALEGKSWSPGNRQP